MCAEYEPTKEVGFPHCVVLYVLYISPWLLSGCCVQNPCVSGRLFLAALVASIPTLGRCRRHRLCQFRIWTTRMTLETWDPSCIWSEWQKDRNSKKAKTRKRVYYFDVRAVSRCFLSSIRKFLSTLLALQGGRRVCSRVVSSRRPCCRLKSERSCLTPWTRLPCSPACCCCFAGGRVLTTLLPSFQGERGVWVLEKCSCSGMD